MEIMGGWKVSHNFFFIPEVRCAGSRWAGKRTKTKIFAINLRKNLKFNRFDAILYEFHWGILFSECSAPDHRTKRRTAGNGSRNRPQLMWKVWKAMVVKEKWSTAFLRWCKLEAAEIILAGVRKTAAFSRYIDVSVLTLTKRFFIRWKRNENLFG